MWAWGFGGLVALMASLVLTKMSAMGNAQPSTPHARPVYSSAGQ